MMSETKQPISKTEAISIARKCLKQGKRVHDIESILAAAGYRSNITGKPLNRAGIYYLLSREKIWKRRKLRSAKDHHAAPMNGGSRSKTGRMPLIRKILETQDLSPDDRIALALLAL